MLSLKVVFIVVIVCSVMGMAYGSTQTMSVEVYSDGLAHISTYITPEEESPALNIALLGSEIDNFIAMGQNDVLLAAEVAGDSALLNTFDSGTVSVKYDVHDLISKDGRVWTFALNSTIKYTLIMPSGAVIVGMNIIPISLDMIDGKTHLELPSGDAVITYILSAVRDSVESDTGSDNTSEDSTVLWVLIAFGAVGAFIAVWYYKRPAAGVQVNDTTPEKTREMYMSEGIQVNDTTPTPESIFERIPDLREDDKEIVRYLFQNGGEASESSIRKKFLQPRTTMWRTIKRLERVGAVSVVKKDSLNVVRLKSNSEVVP